MAKYCPANKYNHALEIARDDPEEGLELLNDLVKKYPSDPSVRHALGMTLLQLDRASQALPHLEHAAAREDRGSDNIANVQFALALAYGGLGMEMHARRAAKKARDLGMTDVPDMGEFSTKDLQGDVPESMNEKDMLLFEQARYKVLYAQNKQGITDMKAFLKRFPSYMPARNILTTGYFVTGDLANYRSMVEETLHVAPKNIHTLVNAVRLTLLTEGPQAAQPWREPIAKAMVRKEEGVVQGLLAQLQAFGFLGDDEGVATTLESIT
jgi:tetratricopeptide (TPR) repeat protein